MGALTGEVLVADGDESIRSLLEVVVRMLPKKPILAADGRSAMELLSSRSFDAVVMDLMLPELSGADVLMWMSRTDPNLLPRCVVVTTEPEQRWKRYRETASVAAVLRKPFSIDDLQGNLRLCCARAEDGQKLA